MLSILHIENIAVIESAEISFDEGFNVLTGETGAGKSIVIDAISTILGQRAYRDMIRTGATHASVRALFTDVPDLPWFSENDVPYDSETVIYRQISIDGKNICKVNGSLVSVSILRQLGLQLINIHGQHDSAELFDESNHLRYLDAFGKTQQEAESYLEKYSAMEDIAREMKKLTMDEGEKLRRMEMLRYQIAEIEKAALQPGEDEALEDRRKLLQNAEKLSSGIEEAVACVYGSDESDGAVTMLQNAERELSRLTKFSDTISSVYQQVKDLMYQVQDVAEQLRDIREDMEYSRDELETIESRLDVIHKLRRKYGTSCADILDYLDSSKAELDAITFSDEYLQKLKSEYAKAEKAATEAAMVLRKKRMKAAHELSARVLKELSQLDMPKVMFSCEFTEVPLSADGADAVAFYMSANAGEAMRPMSKVASGGELARIMLAMKNVLAEQDQVATLIFDEVDTGVSGRAAQKVAHKLRSVAKSKQVLCVTHLPQIAALADTHFLISKEVRGERTFTTVMPLDKKGRIHELARIIGGETITETTLKSAEEMMDI